MSSETKKCIEELLLLFITGDTKNAERGRALYSSFHILNVLPTNAVKVLKEKTENADNFVEYFIYKGVSLDYETLIAILEFYHGMDCYDGGHTEIFNDLFTTGRFKSLLELLETDNERLAELIANLTWEGDWSNE